LSVKIEESLQRKIPVPDEVWLWMGRDVDITRKAARLLSCANDRPGEEWFYTERTLRATPLIFFPFTRHSLNDFEVLPGRNPPERR
jgi:hypothetical protein